MANPQPYKISIRDSDLEELRHRLGRTRFPTQLEAHDGNNWAFGTPVAEIQKLVEYWRGSFDWRKAEAELNELPQYITKVDVEGFGAIDIHFVHQVSPVKNAIPLLFCHGWPGSFVEVKKLLPLLEGGDGKPAFHVVAPSLPNYGFSSGITRKGFVLEKYAEAIHKLMLQLGYEQYVTQGGDWGYSVTRALGLRYPSHVKASHINHVLAHPPSLLSQPFTYIQRLFKPYNSRETAGLARTTWFEKEGFGYNLTQSTKPQTVGFVLSDSPVALLAWIYEKLHDWTDSYPWTPDEILTWISIYWFSTAGPEASVRIYYEAQHPQPQSEVGFPRLCEWIPKVPLGLAHFPREITQVPLTWGRTLGPVVYEKEHTRGGHFAAWEVPDAIVGDLRAMLGKGGACYGVIKGREGY